MTVDQHDRNQLSAALKKEARSAGYNLNAYAEVDESGWLMFFVFGTAATSNVYDETGIAPDVWQEIVTRAKHTCR